MVILVTGLEYEHPEFRVPIADTGQWTVDIRQWSGLDSPEG